MEPTLTWIDLTASDRDRMRRVLDLFGERGTVDELGLGTLRDVIADALFPGTSSIQTRLRYVLFVPWIYQALERRRVGSREVAERARAAEIGLVEPLAAGGDVEGVIGARARATLVRLPSSVYWSAMVRWGIFMRPQSQSWYHTHFASLARGADDGGRADDPGVVWSRQPTWHPRLPPPPDGFPTEASFALTTAEADFVRGRIEERVGGTLLAWLAREGSSAPAGRFWDDPDVRRAEPRIGEVVELARRFSLHSEGAPIVYNLLLAERRRALTGTGDERVEEYRQRLDLWAEHERQEAPFEPKVLWAFVAARGGRLVDPQRRFVEAWTELVSTHGPARIGDVPAVRQLVANREEQLKGRQRARLRNDGRLLDWSSGVGLRPMDYRWFRVRQLLADLHAGLEA